MIPWNPPNPPDKYEASWLRDVLNALKQATNEAADSIRFRTINTAPSKVAAGTVIRADGSNFDPGDGAGFYYYDEGSSDWVKFFTGPVSTSDLTDYTSGTWTPTLTCATPGDLAVTYSTRSGVYRRIGDFILATCTINTSAFTHTTAAGTVQITGLPSTSYGAATETGAVVYQGVTKAGYTNVVAYVPGSTTRVQLLASGSGVGFSFVDIADMPTGGSVALIFSILYRTA